MTFPRIAVWLVGLNVGVWMFLSLLSFMLPVGYFEALLRFGFELPASPAIFVGRPWTLVTYAFAQLSFLHLFFNCIVVGWGTVLVASAVGTARALAVYFAGAIAGGVAFMIVSAFMPAEHEFLIGSSAAAMGLVGSVACLMPQRVVEVLPGLSVRLLWICIALIAVDIILAIAPLNPARVAHLGGACAGALAAVIIRFLSVRKEKKGKVPDHILKKVRQSGLSSLTAQERMRLFDLRSAHKFK